MPVSSASAMAFVTGMAALVGFVGMIADKHTQMVAFVGIAIAAFLYGYCLGALSTVGEAMKLIKEHEKEAAQQTQAQAAAKPSNRQTVKQETGSHDRP